MSDLVVDGSVVAKWFFLEADSAQAQKLLDDAATTSDRLIVLDLVFPEVANAVWKLQRQRRLSIAEARGFLADLARSPVRVEPAARLIPAAFEIAAKYDRSIYDALFVALSQDLNLKGVTADEPLFNAVHKDIPSVVLLRDL